MVTDIEGLFDRSRAPYNQSLFVTEELSATQAEIKCAEKLLELRRERYDWTEVTDEQEKSDLLDKGGFEPTENAVWKRPLPFYSDPNQVALVHAEYEGKASERACIDLEASERIELDGSSPQIHMMNIKNGGLSDREPGAIEEYVSFFCEHVHGEEGGFYCIEHEDDSSAHPLRLVSFDESRVLRGEKANTVNVGFPLTRIERPGDGEGWGLLGSVLYGNNCFRSAFRVFPDGKIDMTEDQHVDLGLIRPMRPKWNPAAKFGGRS